MDAALLTRLLWLRHRLRARDRWSLAQLRRHQEQALSELRRFAYERSPFYSRFHRGKLDRPLNELPILTKAEMMESFDELVTDRSVRLTEVQRHVAETDGTRRFRDHYWVALTSGSTGLRGVFLSNPAEWVAVLASYTRANDWAGIQAGPTHRLRLAVVSSRVPWHQSAQVGMSLRSSFIPVLRLDATEPVGELVARLNEFQPDSLVAYASMARVLAEEQVAGRLRISPRAVMCASEVLTPEAARRIEQAWGVRPFNVYGATETAGIASECSQQAGFHLYEDLVITEVVDEKNRPVPAGTYGAKLLVTVLFSRTQPLIRYEMSDSVRLASNSCPCGRPFALIADIQGRAEEVLRMEGRAGGHVSIHPNLFHRMLEPLPAREWQVIQEAEGLRMLIAGAGPGFDEAALKDGLARELEGQGAQVPAIRIEHLAQLPRTGLGKSPLIRTTLPKATGEPRP
jgi:phenylacetate-CoA ligase